MNTFIEIIDCINIDFPKTSSILQTNVKHVWKYLRSLYLMCISALTVNTAFWAEFPVCEVCVSMMVHVNESVHFIITSISNFNKKCFIRKF